MARKILLDCDPGHDDAIAIMLAYGSPQVELVAVTTVAGNNGITTVSENARAIATLLGMDGVPVSAGAAGPLVGAAVDAKYMHGRSGLDGPERIRPAVALDGREAVQAIVATVMNSEPGELTIVATGPCTNIARAVAVEPRIAERVRQVVVMGGSSGRGNITPYAEFNAYADPVALAGVLNAGWEVALIGLDTTHLALATPEVADALRRIGTRPACFAADLIAYVGKRYLALENMSSPPVHDPCTIAYIINPDVVPMRRARVSVETADSERRGATVVSFADASSVLVGIGLDVAQFWELLFDALERIGEPQPVR
jgi:purine nucleosidase